MFPRNKKPGGRSILLKSLMLLCLLTPLSGKATVFSWTSGAWNQGAPTPGQTKTQTFAGVTGQPSVTVAINNNGASTTGAAWSNGYPQINSTFKTGGLNNVQGFQLYVTSEPNTTSYVKVTLTFSAAVSNVSFTLWDVDYSTTFQDSIQQISATTVSGSTIAASITTTAGYNVVSSGSGLSQVVTGTATATDNTANGNVVFNFGANNIITSFTFEYLDTGALGGQAIAISPITYTPTPEVHPGLAACLACAGVVVFRKFRSSGV